HFRRRDTDHTKDPASIQGPADVPLASRRHPAPGVRRSGLPTIRAFGARKEASVKHRPTHRLLIRIVPVALCVLVARVAPATAQIATFVGCTLPGSVIVQNNDFSHSIDVRLYAVFSEYRSADADCTLANEVQTKGMLITGIQPGTGRAFSFADLGFSFPAA